MGDSPSPPTQLRRPWRPSLREIRLSQASTAAHGRRGAVSGFVLRQNELCDFSKRQHGVLCVKRPISQLESFFHRHGASLHDRLQDAARQNSSTG
jgi:hypothetical protein